MTGRERLIKTFRCEKVDRVPVAPFINFNAVYRHFDIPPERQNWKGNHNLVGKAIELSDYFGFDQLQRHGTPVHQYDEKSSGDSKWQVETESRVFNGHNSEITVITTPEKKLRQVKEFKQVSRYTLVEAVMEYYIKDKDDFMQFVKYQPDFNDSVYPAIKDEFMNLNIAREILKDRGVALGFAGGAFNMLNNYRNLELLLMDPLTNPGFYKAMIEFFSKRILQIIDKLFEHSTDLVEMGGNLATSIVGADFFQKYVLEYEKNIADYIRKKGGFSIYHNCGDAGKIMHLYNEMGISAYGYLTPPPYGDVDLDRALKVIDKNIVLIGNIDQIEFLKYSSPQEIKNRVKEILDKIKERGNFILSTTDWWTDDIPYENIKAFAEAGLEYGSYQ